MSLARAVSLSVAVLALAEGVVAQGALAQGAPAATRFTIKVENISKGEVLKLSNGKTAPFVSAPVLWAVHTGSANPIFVAGQVSLGRAWRRCGDRQPRAAGEVPRRRDRSRGGGCGRPAGRRRRRRAHPAGQGLPVRGDRGAGADALARVDVRPVERPVLLQRPPDRVVRPLASRSPANDRASSPCGMPAPRSTRSRAWAPTRAPGRRRPTPASRSIRALPTCTIGSAIRGRPTSAAHDHSRHRRGQQQVDGPPLGGAGQRVPASVFTRSRAPPCLPHTTTSSSSGPARAAAPCSTDWRHPASGSCSSSAATSCRGRRTTGARGRSTWRGSTRPRSTGATRRGGSSSAHQLLGGRQHEVLRCRALPASAEDFGELGTTAGSRPRGRSATTRSSPTIPRPSASTRCTGSAGWIRPIRPRAAPYPYPAVSHEPRIQQLRDDFARLGLRPFRCRSAIMLDESNRRQAAASAATPATVILAWCRPSRTPRWSAWIRRSRIRTRRC